MDSPAAVSFREALSVVLREYYPAWQKRHSYRKPGSEPPLGVWADTLEAWTTGESFPNPGPFADFLKKADLPDAVRLSLKQRYEHARAAKKKKPYGYDSREQQERSHPSDLACFVGRQIELRDLRKFFAQRHEELRLLTIHAFGGMGKTALARVLADEVMRMHGFEHLIWIDAGQERFDNLAVYPLWRVDVTLDGIVRQFVNELGLEGEQSVAQSRITRNLKQYLRQHPVLLVLDGIELNPDKMDLMVLLLEILGTLGTMMITTHEKFDAPYQYQYSVGPILQEDGPSFLREWADIFHVRSVVDSQDDVLNEIWAKTGGLPLAMRLVVGQLHTQPLNIVLGYLKVAQAKLNDGSQHQNSEFYRYLYSHSWTQLNFTSRQLLVWVALQPAGLAVSSMLKMAGLSADKLYSVMKPLQHAGLIDLEGGPGSERYNCHSITRYFVLGMINDGFHNSTR